MNTRRTIPLVLASLLVLSAAACGGDDDDASSDTTTPAAGDTVDAEGLGPVVVGSADFPESQLIAQIYGQALAADGFEVSYENAIGAREVYYDAIQSGEVDLVPEYTNSLLSFVVRQDDPAALPTATNVDEQISELGEVLPDGLEVLPPSSAEDKDVIVCTKEVADKYSLTNLSELGEVAPDITIGGPPEFEDRAPFGLIGFKDIYGADFGDFVPLDIGAVADALVAAKIDCGNLFSTMSVITTDAFVTLEDDKGTVPNEAVLPLVRSEVASDQLKATLDNVNQQLTTDDLKAMMVQVEVDAAAPDVVAQEWLATIS